MRTSSLLVVAGIFEAIFFQAVSAEACIFTNPATGTNVTAIVFSQDEIDTKLKGCTSLTHTLVIGHNFTGDLVLPRGLANLTQGIRTSDENVWEGSPYESGLGVPGLTSISAPDVLEIGNSWGIYFANISALASVSFEKLQTTTDIRIACDNEGGASLDFPALTSIRGSLNLRGDFSRMNFPILASVERFVAIVNREIYDRMYIDDGYMTEYPPLDIDFPSLEQTMGMKLTGNISSVSFPLLAVVRKFVDGPSVWSSQGGRLEIMTRGNPLELALPALFNTTDIELTGTFANVSFPLLRHVDYYQARSKLPMDYDLTPLESSESVDLSGNITSYNISSFKNVTSMVVSSALNPKCKPGKDKFVEMGQPSSRFMCFYDEPKKFPKLAVGLGVGLGVPALALFVACVVRAYNQERKRIIARKDPLPDYETEMETRRTGGGETLPVYEEEADKSGATHITRASNSTGDVTRPVERPLPPPPPPAAQ